MKKKLSIHRPSKQLLNNKESFGHYLAGLIDADGHISTIKHIVIAFNSRDHKDALKLRKKIGFGKVRKVKNKNAVNLIISNKKGIHHVAILIKDKLKHPKRIEQYNNRLNLKTSLNNNINWNSPWFAGFIDGDGCFRIQIIQHRKEVRLLCQIDQKNDILLKQIKLRFGGYLGYRMKQDTYYYSTVSYRAFNILLNYLDKYSLQYSYSYLRYTILRKAYLIIQKKQHLTIDGFNNIKKLKDMI